MTDLDAIRQDNEPLRRSLDMAMAVAQFLGDLVVTEDPGDDDDLPAIECAARKADALVDALTRLCGGRR